MGKCVVAHSIACEGIEVTPGHNVVIADTAQAFAGAIQELLNDSYARERIGRAARCLAVERYSFAQIGEKLCEVFEAAVESPIR